MITRPMLAGKLEPHHLKLLKFPLYATPKIDGVRAYVKNGVLLSRTGKHIPNAYLQNRFLGLPDGFDGELYSPDLSFQQNISHIMSDFKPAPMVNYYIFDWYGTDNYLDRIVRINLYLDDSKPGIIILPIKQVNNLEDLDRLENQYINYGWEGVILRADAPYKFGRSTLREQGMLKLKRFKESEAKVLDVEEWQTNTAQSTLNELGLAHKTKRKEDMVGGQKMGKLIVRDIHTGVEFKIGSGFNDMQRKELWDNPPIDQILTYKYFPYGEKDKPRHPIFKGWRFDI